jgi:hypothetical protein
MFVNTVDHILAQANSDMKSIEKNLTMKLTNMCNWDDPESGTKYR